MACSFCGRTSRKAPSYIQFNDFMDVCAGAIFKYYNHAVNEAITWDSEDQQYDGTTQTNNSPLNSGRFSNFCFTRRYKPTTRDRAAN
jgi:hypothetical protein